MSWGEAITIGAVVLMGAWLAGRAPLPARVVLWACAALVSAVMFLPSSALVWLFGSDQIKALTASAAHLPWTLSTIAHFAAFLLLAAVIWLCRPEWRGWRAVGVLAVLAIGSELMQGLGPDRSPNLTDVAVNLLGAATGLLLGRVCGWTADTPPAGR